MRKRNVDDEWDTEKALPWRRLQTSLPVSQAHLHGQAELSVTGIGRCVKARELAACAQPHATATIFSRVYRSGTCSPPAVLDSAAVSSAQKCVCGAWRGAAPRHRSISVQACSMNLLRQPQLRARHRQAHSNRCFQISPVAVRCVPAAEASRLDPVTAEASAWAPATVANLGPGFDWMGCAVNVRSKSLPMVRPERCQAPHLRCAVLKLM